MSLLYLRTIPKTLNWLALVSLVVLALKVFVLNSTPQLFRGAYELGVVFEGVLGSTLASYVFYLIVVHVKETNDKRVISPHISRWATRIVGQCKQQIAAFESASGVKLELDSLTQEQVDGAFSKINPRSKAPLAFSLTESANWIQYLAYHKDRTNRYISKILSQLIFLDAPLVSLLTQIDDSDHFYVVESLVHIPIGNANLSTFSTAFYKYCVACRALKLYLQDHPGYVAGD